MAIDNKYGRVTLQYGDIGPDELVVVFRAKDQLLPKVLMHYHLFCMKLGSPKRHLDLIFDTLVKVEQWQKENESKIKVPDSENSRKWMDK